MEPEPEGKGKPNWKDRGSWPTVEMDGYWDIDPPPWGPILRLVSRMCSGNGICGGGEEGGLKFGAGLGAREVKGGDSESAFDVRFRK